MDELIHMVAVKYGLPSDLIRRLIDYEQSKVHLERRRGAKDEIRRIIENHQDEQPK